MAVAATSSEYQARADAAAAEARIAATTGARERQEVARENWQRLADQARSLEDGRAQRKLAGSPDGLQPGTSGSP
jgi:hypothetical protein